MSYVLSPDSLNTIQQACFTETILALHAFVKQPLYVCFTLQINMPS